MKNSQLIAFEPTTLFFCKADIIVTEPEGCGISFMNALKTQLKLNITPIKRNIFQEILEGNKPFFVFDQADLYNIESEDVIEPENVTAFRHKNNLLERDSQVKNELVVKVFLLYVLIKEKVLLGLKSIGMLILAIFLKYQLVFDGQDSNLVGTIDFLQTTAIVLLGLWILLSLLWIIYLHKEIKSTQKAYLQASIPLMIFVSEPKLGKSFEQYTESGILTTGQAQSETLRSQRND
jgi:tRNA-binding EMAP/Myf-like protein